MTSPVRSVERTGYPQRRDVQVVRVRCARVPGEAPFGSDPGGASLRRPAWHSTIGSTPTPGSETTNRSSLPKGRAARSVSLERHLGRRFLVQPQPLDGEATTWIAPRTHTPPRASGGGFSPPQPPPLSLSRWFRRGQWRQKPTRAPTATRQARRSSSAPVAQRPASPTTTPATDAPSWTRSWPARRSRATASSSAR